MPRVLTAALDLKPIHGKNGLEITPDTKIESLEADELFALIVPGGWAPDKLRRHSAVKELVRNMDVTGKADRHHLPRWTDRHLRRDHEGPPRNGFAGHQG